MNRLPPMQILVLVFVLVTVALPFTGAAAPVGNLGDAMLWNPGPFRIEGGLAAVISLGVENQTNRLPSQMTRFAWINPNNVPAEERHYQQVRSSKNELTTMGAKIGIPYKDKALVYLVAGTSEASVDLHYEDWTVAFRAFETDSSFESDSDVFYGVGLGFIMHRGEYRKIPMTLGMDISYRRYSIEENRIATDGLSYASDLDEIQLAVCLSAQLKRFSPYAGVKISSITGTEDYVNQNEETSYFDEGYIHYTEDITWSKDVGYFFGVTTSIKGFLSVGLEFRGGDENAMGINATTRF